MEKKEDLEDLEALNQVLVVKDWESNDELQKARQELIGLRIILNGIMLLYIWNERSMELFLHFLV